MSEIPRNFQFSQYDNLIVHGQLLTTLYENDLQDSPWPVDELRQIFEDTVLKFKCVVFSRTTPKQKAHMVKLVRERGHITLAVGDGANDVNMIQAAHVGVGIIGNEGRQAANASDFALHGFANLERWN